MPWVICAMVTYCLNAVRSGTFGIGKMFNWVIGYGTWYYFAFVLLLLYVIFTFFNSDKFCYITIVITILSILIYSILGGSSYEYINVFNWIGFFGFGIVMRRHRLDRLLIQDSPCTWLSLAMFVLGCGITIYRGEFGYFHIVAVLYESAAFVLLLKLCSLMEKKNKLLVFIGQQTFFIYLTHMQIVQAIGARVPSGIVKFTIYPVIGTLIMALLCLIILRIVRKIPKMQFVAQLLGMKVN